MKLALTRTILGSPVAKLAPYFDVNLVDPHRPLTPDELKNAVHDADVLICMLTDRIDEDLLKAAPKLKCVITHSVGVDHVDRAALARRGIVFAHTPDVLTSATAELAWALILACARRLKPASQSLSKGSFPGFLPSGFLGLELEGATLGIIGYGRIGKAVARRGLGFGMHVICYSHRKLEHLDKDVKQVSLETLLEMSDVVSLHCPLTDDTRHLISAAELLQMKKNAVLINTARGPIIDEVALSIHLRIHPEFQAGLDVYERAPELTPGLVDAANAFCVPHIGSATVAARTRMAETCITEAIRFAKGEPLKFLYGKIKGGIHDD